MAMRAVIVKATSEQQRLPRRHQPCRVLKNVIFHPNSPMQCSKLRN